jgi:hypothetical protein
MTSDQIKELRKLAEAASPGEWVQGFLYDGTDWVPSKDGGQVRFLNGKVVSVAMDLQSKNVRYADAAFVAAANPTAILSLLARVEELESNIELWSHQKAWLLKSHADLAVKLAIAQQDKGKEIKP